MTLPRLGVRQERGATAVFVAAILLVLMALVSLAVDGGLGFNDRRGTQNAADLAALAAAWEACNPISAGSADPEGAARRVAAENGYIHDGTGTSVVVSGGSSQWDVVITENNTTTFGRATPYAPDDLTIESAATAQCVDTGALDGYAIFGNATSCPAREVDLQSSTLTVNGGVHSNGNFRIPNNSTIVGQITYRDTPNVNNSGTAETYYPGGAIGYPEPLASLSIAEYAPGGARALAAGSFYHPFTGVVGTGEIDAMPGNDLVGSELVISVPGIYYTSDRFNVANDIRLIGPALVRGVTFVADDSIQVKGFSGGRGFELIDGTTDLGLFMFANGDGSADCFSQDIKVSTNGGSWTGVFYAPNGAIDISGSSFASLNGALIGYRVSISASNFTLTYDGGTTTDPNYRVDLVR